MCIRDSTSTVNLAYYFVNGETLTYTCTSDDAAVATVTVGNNLMEVQMCIRDRYEEHPNKDYTDDNKHKDKYKAIGTAKCDSAVWLPAGTYQVTSYTI